MYHSILLVISIKKVFNCEVFKAYRGWFCKGLSNLMSMLRTEFANATKDSMHDIAMGRIDIASVHEAYLAVCHTMPAWQSHDS